MNFKADLKTAIENVRVEVECIQRSIGELNAELENLANLCEAIEPVVEPVTTTAPVETQEVAPADDNTDPILNKLIDAAFTAAEVNTAKADAQLPATASGWACPPPAEEKLPEPFQQAFDIAKMYQPELPLIVEETVKKTRKKNLIRAVVGDYKLHQVGLSKRHPQCLRFELRHYGKDHRYVCPVYLPESNVQEALDTLKTDLEDVIDGEQQCLRSLTVNCRFQNKLFSYVGKYTDAQCQWMHRVIYKIMGAQNDCPSYPMEQHSVIHVASAEESQISAIGSFLKSLAGHPKFPLKISTSAKEIEAQHYARTCYNTTVRILEWHKGLFSNNGK